MILAGDIGGTHTRFAIFDQGKKIAEKKYASQKYHKFIDVLSEFLQSEKKSVSTACFGIAGPVRGGRCQATNLPWVVDAKEISHLSRIKVVHLINDLEANAYGINMLKEEEFSLIHKGETQSGNRALISAGTGLGEAGLYWDGHKYSPFACEGGHVDFAARDDFEIDLFIYLKKKYGHVSYERVVSGPGLQEIYSFLIETKREKPSLKVEEEMRHVNPAEVIVKWGSKELDGACSLALRKFLSIYASEAGNLCLKFLALGGLFIGGGIAPILLEEMKSKEFIESFSDKGRFKDVLLSIPIKVILNDDAALLGAYYFAGR